MALYYPQIWSSDLQNATHISQKEKCLKMENVTLYVIIQVFTTSSTATHPAILFADLPHFGK
jgi:hypothetical protein